ncbi:MAG: plastocyanin/azurin family copper-binding protein [Solirubrobacterales bacterium]
MRRAGLGLVLLAALLLVLPAAADAANRRISISDYQWSNDEVNLDLGEHVTWYWTGPDTMHSVTGQPPNAKQWDSDPGSLPRHDIGDNYQITFDQPGIYHFQCKIHSLVSGTVVVSNTPGDPETEPDSVPKSNVDLKPPKLRGLQLATKFGPDGSPARYSLNESGKLDVEYYRLNRKGKGRFAGWATYKAYVGYNRARIGKRKPHFTPKPGRYVAEFRVTDKAHNTSKAKKRSFRIW